MRAKSDIIAYLASQLTDDIWKKLQNSLLGRELLAFGAEVISENENVKDTMLLQMNPETADKNGLYMLSQMNEIPITNIKPSTLVVQMADSVKTYAPYELQYNVGNVHFTNIEYTMQGKSVSLINGTHKCYAVGMDISEGAIADGGETFFYDGTTTYSGIKLGNAYPDSIVVTDENGLEIPRYSSDIALSNKIDMMYKVVTGVDGNTFVRFLKGNDTIQNPTAYKIDWLDHSAMEFEVDDTSVTDPNIAGDDKTVATIEYYSQGVVDDLDYMRQQLKKEMAKYNGLNTPVSVENYVKGMPYILDAKCEKGEDGLCVYVKPSSPTQDNYSMYLDFSEVAAHISLNSILFPNIKVRTANQIMFGVEISGVSDLKLQQGIKSLLQERFAYENMDFNTVINTGSILSEIYGKYGIVPTINMTIKEQFVNGKPLSFTPIKNSLKLYGVDDKILGWEDNGLLYGKTNIGSAIPFALFDVVGSMGTMFLLKQQCYEEDSASQTYFGKKLTYYTDGLYNRFYIYDVSTNTIKPFDSTLKNLLFTDQNNDLKYSSWDAENRSEDEPNTQSFGNLYDIKFLSTNNALVVQFVFRSSGADVISNDKEYWSNSNLDNYDFYLRSGNYTTEIVDNYKGKYQTTFFVNNPLALKNQIYENWQVFQDAAHGITDEMQGLYGGLRNITNLGGQLDIKSNWFIHNNKQYYAYEISEKYVCITNGAKNLKINLNGSFLGMIPFENDLYVINGTFITRVIGFEGLKEQEKVYRVYKNLNTPITITQIIREFDNQIAFKTSDNKFYTATGFDILADNMIGFKELKQVFNDTLISDDVVISGCTKDYVTAYKVVSESNKMGYQFYCYDLNTLKTYSYEKVSNVSPSNNTEDENNPLQSSYAVNLASYFPSNFNDSVYHLGNTGVLAYRTDSGVRKSFSNLNDLFVVELKPVDNQQRFGLFLNNVMMNGELCAVPVWLYRGNSPYYILNRYGAKWANNGTTMESSTSPSDIDTDNIVGFYKACLRNFMSNKNSFQNNFSKNNKPIVSKIVSTENLHIKVQNVTITKTLDAERTTTYRDGSNNDVEVKDFYGFGVHPNLVSINGGYKTGSEYPTIKTNQDIDNTKIIEDVSLSTNKIYCPENIIDFHNRGEILPNEIQDRFKLNLEIFVNETTEYETAYELNIENSTEESAITNIGYFDTNNNSCVNESGSQAVTIRYNTQNPNVTSGSYLMLDESEIKFI